MWEGYMKKFTKEFAFPRVLFACDLNLATGPAKQGNVLGIALSLADNTAGNGFLDKMGPPLAIQFHSGTTWLVCQNPFLLLLLHFFPFNEQHTLVQHRLAATNNKVTGWNFSICGTSIS